MNSKKERPVNKLYTACFIMAIALSGNTYALTHQKLPSASSKSQTTESFATIINGYVASPRTEKFAAFFGVTANNFERNLLMPEVFGTECEVVVTN